MNNGKLSNTEGIRNVNGETTKKVGEEWYKHLGMMELDREKENDMNDTLKSDGQEKSAKILISWHELKNQFLSFFVHR